MEEQFSDLGQLIIPSGNSPVAAVVFYPPATGEKGQQRAEAQKLASYNVASLLYNPPYRRGVLHGRDQGGIGDPQGEIKLWHSAKAEFPLVVENIRKRFSVARLPIFVIGKNLGGSVAAYSINDSVSCLIVTGSVPRLSRFWAESSFPVALENRKGFSTTQISQFKTETQPFDLTETAAKFPVRSLVQFGENDPWIELQDVQALERKLTKPLAISKVNDDHAMAAEPTTKARIEFVRGCL